MTVVGDLEGDCSFDYVIVGGGTAGCVVASRLAEGLPDAKILMIEGGSNDFGNETILRLKGLVDLWGKEGYDYGYRSEPQPHGNSDIIHSRAKMLGGCSSHNAVISFLPLDLDMQRWQKLGAKGWTHAEMMRLYRKLRNNIIPVDERHRNDLAKDWVETCAKVFDVPVMENFIEEIQRTGSVSQAVGFLNLAYTPDNGHRSSASVAYIHPILRGDEARPNLTILHETWVSKILFQGDAAAGVRATTRAGRTIDIHARREVVLSAGAVDTPRLMLLSGLGPQAQLESLGIPVVRDIAGVGENLQDHVDTLYMWELEEEVPEDQVITRSEAVMVLRREAENANGDDGDAMDVMFHSFAAPFPLNTAPMGYDTPRNAFCVIPYIARPASVGRVYLKSADATAKPALDFRYFSDAKGYDQATNLWALKMARKMAESGPFRRHIKREVAPGLHLQTDEELDTYARRVSNTVYHPCGTAKMGNVEEDAAAVVDSSLRVRGVRRLRVADASVFPCMTSINPMITVLCVGERAAELVLAEARETKLSL